MVKKAVPLQSSNNVNIDQPPPPSQPPAAAAGKKTIEEMYQKKTQLEHILLRPDTYVGSVEKHTQTLWVYDESNHHMVNRSITYVPGLYKIFDEILVNAADNKQRDPKMKWLKVSIDVADNLISVYNDGDGVPVEIHQEEKVYVPELIFGHLLTSSNYDDNEKKTTGGRNGYGAKLTNIFSTEFVIETADGKRQKKYKQVFSNNMGNKSEAVITKCKAGENWTKVSFKPDLAKFQMTYLEEDVVALMKKRVVDLAGCLGNTVKVELNGNLIPVKSFGEYADLYLKSAEKSRSETELSLPRIHAKVGDRWEIYVSLSDGQFQQVSFVNSIATIKGGSHVDYITNQITSFVMTKVNKKNKTANVKAHNVKNHLWVFVNALIDNPAFDSQTKETLTTKQSNFGSKCEIPEMMLKQVEKSGIVEALLSWADFKQNKDLKKTDGTKSQSVRGIVKLEDANDAGGRNSHECTLILTEGDSAKALAMAGIAQAGRDKYGVFPLKGKLLNVREASSKQILDNTEIQNIKKILGLQQNKVYTNVKSLRYGHLMIMTDQDHDGSHIKGLLVNFIHSFWPSLLKVPSFLLEFTTPIIRATRKDTKKKPIKEIISFYSMPEYEAWKESMGNKVSEWEIKYYKGLGTSTQAEGREYFKNLQKHRKQFVWESDYDAEAIELAFSKKKAEDRKTWIRNFEPNNFRDPNETHISYRDFVNKELILFSRADLQRSIPSLVDGLKPGQRKILYCSFKKKLFNEIKVAQFIGYVSEQSAYHHGEQSLATTIIGMAQHFVGSNNINLLLPNGQFGTRYKGGKDHASARYIFTELNPITRCIFPQDDDNLLEYLNDDGKSIEPNWYIPIIPMVLVNGSEGIGTGWSSYIPNYNPRDIISNVRRLMKGEAMIPMDPWFRGYKGVIIKSEKEGGYIVNGTIEELDDQSFRITELPLRKWTIDYKEFLESVTVGSPDAKDPFIEEYRQNGDEETIDIIVTMQEAKVEMIRKEGLMKKFKLTGSISTNNMNLFDAEGKIKKYDTPEQVIEEFFPLRLEYYERRKKYKMDTLKDLLVILENKVRFILGVVNGEIIVSNRRKAELVLELKQKGFTPIPKKAKSGEPRVAGADDDNSEEPENEDSGMQGNGPEVTRIGDYEYLLSMSIGTLTLESVQKLIAQRDENAAQLEILKATTSLSMWMKDLDELEKKLDEFESEEAEEQRKRATQAYYAGTKVSKKGRKKPPPPPKNTKKANIDEPETQTLASSSSMEIENAAEVAAKPKKNNKKGNNETVTVASSSMEIENAAEVVPKPKGRAASKKVPPAKKVDDDEIQSLQERLASYNMLASSGQSPEAALETEDPTLGAGKKGNTTRGGGGRKKPSSSRAVVLSDTDNEDDVGNADEKEDDGDDFLAVPEAGKKKGGRKPAGQNAKKPTAAGTRKRGGVGNKQSPAALGQEVITNIKKPTESGPSPLRKVRKMRESPFNKKSGSLLGRVVAEQDENGSGDIGDMSLGSASTSQSIEEAEEVVEISAPVAAARPQRANRTRALYVLSETEDDDEDDEDVDVNDIDESESDFDDED